VVLEIAGDPHTAVEEHEYRKLACRVFGFHDVQLHGAAVLLDRLRRDDHPGQVHRSLGLQPGQHRAHLWARQGPDRGGVLVHVSEEGAYLRVDAEVVGGVGPGGAGRHTKGKGRGQEAIHGVVL
jgi:hypothetical protein